MNYYVLFNVFGGERIPMRTQNHWFAKSVVDLAMAPVVLNFHSLSYVLLNPSILIVALVVL